MYKLLEGSLPSFGVPDLLELLGRGRRTGALVLERGDAETKIFLREGRPVFASTTVEALRLGALLVRRGRLSSAQLERALQRHRTGGRIGQALIGEKVLSEEELATLLKVQVSEMIFDCFAWCEGVFSFYGGVSSPAMAVTLDMNPLNLVLEGVRRLEPGAGPAEALAERDRVVEAIVNPERVKRSAILTEEEWRIFFLVDGRRSVAEICSLSGDADELPTLQILQRLLAARLIELAPSPVAADPSSTHRRLDEPRAGPRAPSVEFSPPPRAAPPEDDTLGIINKKAVQYMSNADRLTVSRLVLVSAAGETSFPLVRDSYTLGRHRNNDIVISDPKVSSFHARIDRAPEGFALVDLKSRNGCWVNGQRVQTALLKTGDELRLGAAQLVYKVDYTSSV